MKVETSEDSHSAAKRKGQILGISLLGSGVVIAVIGLVLFLSTAFPSITGNMGFEDILGAFGQSFIGSFIGLIILFVGSVMVIIGIYVLFFSNIGKIASYVADETAPATTTMSGAVTKGLREGGGIPIDVSVTESKEKIKIKCQNCGALNDEDDTYCSKCGESL
ncbi:MAG: zinc ribbon domain-containing protein [Promethearchaeota archaeon]